MEKKDLAYTKKHVEQDYESHQQNPAPSEEAVKEKDDRGVGKLILWALIIASLALTLVYFFFM